MTETVKERIYREALETMSDSDFMGNKYVKKFVKGVFKQIEDVPGTTDKLSVEKLQEQLNTAKNFFKDILDVNPSFYGGNSVRHLHNCVRVMRISADKALAALEGGEDE